MQLIRLTYILFFSLVCSLTVNAQVSNNYNYLKSDEQEQSSIAKQLNEDYKSICKSTKNKELKAFYTKRFNALNNTIKRNSFLFDDFFYPYFNSILAKIREKNSGIEIPIHSVLVGRSAVPNAYCYGNGFVVINLGLIRYLDNEDQLAFIIAHEISHQLFNHVDNGAKRRISYQKSKEYKEKLKTLSKQEFNRNQAYESFFLDNELAAQQHNRKVESQADSMGLALLLNTSYSKDKAVNTLKVLKDIDEDKYQDSILFSSIFSSKNQLFNPDWIAAKSGLNIKQEQDQDLIDSLKTHPDCDKRIAYVNQFFNVDDKERFVDSSFSTYNQRADNEIFLRALLTQNYTWGVKELLTHPAFHRGASFHNTIFNLYLGELYFAMKNHSLNMTPRPKDEHSYNFRKMALLIQNIRLSELKRISTDYLEAFVEKQTEEEVNEHMLYATFLLAKIKNEEAKAEEYKNNYLTNYPKGVHKQQIINL